MTNEWFCALNENVTAVPASQVRSKKSAVGKAFKITSLLAAFFYVENPIYIETFEVLG